MTFIQICIWIAAVPVLIWIAKALIREYKSLKNCIYCHEQPRMKGHLGCSLCIKTHE